MKRYEGQSLFKHAGYSLASHCPGLAGLIVFEYVVFKQSLSRVPMAFETDTPLYPLIFSRCLLVSTVLFSCSALLASCCYMVIDYTRRLAIEKSLVLGMALQVPLDKVQGSWLGLMTMLLACLNMIILLADLCWSMFRVKEIKWEELSAELVARVAPLLFYMVNLRDIARSPKISWFRIQGFMQNPCTVNQLFEALPERSDTFADEQLRRGMTCVLASFRRCWKAVRRRFRTPENPEPLVLEMRSLDAAGISSEVRASSMQSGQSGTTLSGNELRRTKTFEKVFGTDAPHLVYHFPALASDRPGAMVFHTCVCVLFVVAMVIGGLKVVPHLYRDAFVPQVLDVDIIGATGSGCYNSPRFVEGVECWIVPETGKKEVTLIWKPDPTLASTFYLCPLDICNQAAPILIENHLGRAHEAIVKMALNSTAFGQRSSFRMRGFFERTLGIAVVSLSHLLVTVGGRTEDGLHTVFRRAQIFPESTGIQRQSQEINFHLAANWRLFHLKASGEATLRLLDKRLRTTELRSLGCADPMCAEDYCSLRCYRLDPMVCKGSCDIYLNITLQPRLKAREPTGDEHGPTLTQQIGVKIRDLDGYYLQALLDKQKQVENHMRGSTPSLLNLALERRNQLLQKAFEESKVGPDGKGPWTKRLLLIGLTGAGKSSACFFLLNQSSCKFSNSAESHTRQVIEVTGPAFGDPRAVMPELKIFDIPGFADTKGTESDQNQWAKTVTHLRNQTGEDLLLDGILWIVNGAIRRQLDLRRQMLRQYRRTFGPAFYDHLRIIINFVPMIDHLSTDDILKKWNSEFRSFMLKEEKDLLGKDWEPLKARVEEAIEQKLSIHVVNLNPMYLATQRLSVPLSAPLVQEMPPFSSPVNLPDLLKLVQDLRDQAHPPLNLSAGCVRIGVGEVNASASRLELRVPPNKSQVLVEATLVGRFLGSGDGLLAQPGDKDCGSAAVGESCPLRRDGSGKDQTHQSSFRLNLPSEVLAWNSVKFCFCEAPGCDKISRHCQDAGTIPFTVGAGTGNLEEFCGRCLLDTPEVCVGEYRETRVHSLATFFESPVALVRQFGSISIGRIDIHMAKCGIPCPAGVEGEIRWSNSLQRYSGSCVPVKCPQNSSSSGKFISQGCNCDEGFQGEIWPEVGPPYYSGGCIARPCPANSTGEAPNCRCLPGFKPTMKEAAIEVMLLLACEPVLCPTFSNGIDVPSGCRCFPGMQGEIVAEAWTPFYSGNCGEASNQLTGEPCSGHSFPGSPDLPHCECSSGYQRGNDTSLCVAAPCPPHSTGDSVAAGCDCEPGYAGIITARSVDRNIPGSPWTGRCRARPCPASTRGASLPSGCACLPNFEGQIIPTAVPPNFFRGRCTEDVKRFALHTFGGNAAEILAEALLDRPLTVLDLSDSSIGDEEVRTLATFLPRSQLKHLDLRGNPMIQIAGVASIAAFGKGLESLSFQDTSLSISSLVQITDMLPGSALRKLNLRNACPYRTMMQTNPWMESLRKVLPHSELQSLDIGKNKLSSQEVVEVARGLAGSQLKELRLDSNELKDNGAMALAMYLDSCSLRSLDLSQNEIHDLGAETLANALPVSKLEVLDLSIQEIADKGAEALAKALLRGSQLYDLRLDGNYVCKQGAISLAKALSKGVSLKHLSLTINLPSDAALEALAIALPKSQLVSLELMIASVHCREVAALAKELPRSQLQTLRLNLPVFDISCAEEITAFAKAVPSSKLTNLDTDWSKVIRVGGVQALEAALQKLHSLDLTSLNVEELQLVAKVLPTSSVTRLTREISEHTPGALYVISQILEDSQTKIEELDLGVQGDLLVSEALALLNALPRSKLTTLAMPRVPWHYELASAFREALASSSSHLRYVYFFCHPNSLVLNQPARDALVEACSHAICTRHPMHAQSWLWKQRSKWDDIIMRREPT